MKNSVAPILLLCSIIHTSFCKFIEANMCLFLNIKLFSLTLFRTLVFSIVVEHNYRFFLYIERQSSHDEVLKCRSKKLFGIC